ncbi:SWR1 complex bromodomain subunit bdf1 [Smittium mucronatum]|uniref:SWR1 complex bromodomain subunit bdf1 n=1 Tax=Smittium mucronatum TaxID=133383 RepID=A0A1R0GWJ4_9FUNG|nr:SWR1 complex bromodomain subunit bdf1 [Smittium mucronatum]
MSNTISPNSTIPDSSIDTPNSQQDVPSLGSSAPTVSNTDLPHSEMDIDQKVDTSVPEPEIEKQDSKSAGSTENASQSDTPMETAANFTTTHEAVLNSDSNQIASEDITHTQNPSDTDSSLEKEKDSQAINQTSDLHTTTSESILEIDQTSSQIPSTETGTTQASTNTPETINKSNIPSSLEPNAVPNAENSIQSTEVNTILEQDSGKNSLVSDKISIESLNTKDNTVHGENIDSKPSLSLPESLNSKNSSSHSQASDTTNPKPDTTNSVDNSVISSQKNENHSGTDNSKRALSSSATEDVHSFPSKKSKSEPLTLSQKDSMIKIVIALQNNKDSGPFLEPVDPILFEIPDYLDVIKHPMDLSTVLSKLNDDKYTSLNEVDSDIKQIFENCFIYNGIENSISTMAKHLQKAYSNLLKKYNEQLSVAEVKKSQAPIVPDLQAQLKSCNMIIKELFKKQYQDIAFYFYEPVDYVSLKIPNYPKIITNPMDLGTISAKLTNNQYQSIHDFYNDVKLVFQNCYKFNPKKHPVHIAGKSLEAVFDGKWTEYFGNLDESSKASKRQSSVSSDRNGIDDGSDNSSTPKQSTDGSGNKNRRSTKTPKSSKKMDQPSSQKSGTKQRSSADNDINEADLTIQEKLKLSTVIETLPPDRLQIAFDIIQSGYPEVIEQKEEIELDIDVLDYKTLRRLYEYVVFEKNI